MGGVEFEEGQDLILWLLLCSIKGRIKANLFYIILIIADIKTAVIPEY